MPFVGKTSVAVWIVDPSPGDYTDLVEPAARTGVDIRYLPTGREAIRATKSLSPDLWIVNVTLPDMSGFELVQQLRPRAHGADLFLVSDAYREDDEIRAISLGVTIHLCKPVRPCWLSQWHPRSQGAT